MATIWYSTDYQVDIDVLRRYLLLLIKFDNLFLRLFHTFGCKQTLFKMLTDSSAFATLGDAHGEHPNNSSFLVKKIPVHLEI